MSEPTKSHKPTTETGESHQSNKWSSRKFWAMMLWQSVMVGLLAFKVLPPEPFVAITWLILGGYFVGNVTQHIAGARK